MDKNKPSNKLTLIILSYCFPHSTYWQSAKEGELVVAFPIAENSEYPALPKQPTTIYLLPSSIWTLSYGTTVDPPPLGLKMVDFASELSQDIDLPILFEKS